MIPIYEVKKPKWDVSVIYPKDVSPRFLISVLTYRMESGVTKCLESVANARGNYTLHLTANGNNEAANYFSGLSKVFPNVVTVINKTNLGFIIPNNQAMHYAQEHCYDYLVLLNDDALVPQGWLAAIEAEFNRNPAAAIVGASGNCRTLNQDFHGFHGPTLDYIEGSAAAYKVSVWQKHFKTLFPSWLTFCYAEDASASIEVCKLGYTIHEANFTIEHNRGATSKHVPQAKIAQTKNHEIAKEKYAHFLKTKSFVHRIIVQREAAHGDVLMTEPIIKALYEQNPLCRIYLETACLDVLKGCPYLSGIAKTFSREPDDLIINLNGSYEAAPMRHVITSYARTAGLEDVPHQCRIYPSENKIKELETGKWCIMHIGPTTWAGKNWSFERFFELGKCLKIEGWSIMLVGHGTDKFGLEDCDLRSKTASAQDLAAVIQKGSLFIGLDSFPMHVALALGIPTVGIFGVTSSKYLMHGTNYIGCDADDTLAPTAGMRHRVSGEVMVHENGDAIRTVTIEQVLTAVEQLTYKKIHA